METDKLTRGFALLSTESTRSFKVGKFSVGNPAVWNPVLTASLPFVVGICVSLQHEKAGKDRKGMVGMISNNGHSFYIQWPATPSTPAAWQGV